MNERIVAPKMVDCRLQMRCECGTSVDYGFTEKHLSESDMKPPPPPTSCPGCGKPTGYKKPDMQLGSLSEADPITLYWCLQRRAHENKTFTFSVAFPVERQHEKELTGQPVISTLPLR